MKLRFLFALLPYLISCSQVTNDVNRNDYPLQVGDIYFDKRIDDPDFKICNREQILQYYYFSNGLQYKGEKVALEQYFQSKFSNSSRYGETGYITIRFVVNCHGKTGLFRVQEMSESYEFRKFDKDLVVELTNITKSLDGWIIGQYENKASDYYQYLTFKIVDGVLLEILP
jgi:hypothetical protein